MNTEIYKKIKKFKEENVKLQKDTQGYGYKYATLDQIQEKINPILDNLGLVIVDRTEDQKVITEIVDIENKEKIKSEISIGNVETERYTYDKEGRKKGLERNTLDPQGVGSIITYYRRYNRVQLLDLEQEDDDGTSGSGRGKNMKSKYTKKKKKSKSKGVKKTNKKYKNNKDKKWFNDPELEDFKNNKVDNFDNAEEALKTIRKHFKISTSRVKKIKDLYS